MRQYLPAVALFALLSTAALAQAPDLPVDGRIRVMTYTKSDVYTLPTKYGYQTNIVFAPGEEIETISVGDRALWQIVPSGNRIFIRPMDDELSTNMTVITNRREYTFDIISVPEDGTNNLYVMQFRYPDEPRKDVALDDGDMPAMAAPVTPIAPATVPPGTHVEIPPLDTQRTNSINEAYTYTGPDAVAPGRVYDDGVNTYVIYNSMPRPMPVPMVEGSGGKMVVANHGIDGNRLTIYSVGSGFVLTGPYGDVTVYNEYSTPKAM